METVPNVRVVEQSFTGSVPTRRLEVVFDLLLLRLLDRAVELFLLGLHELPAGQGTWWRALRTSCSASSWAWGLRAVRSCPPPCAFFVWRVRRGSPARPDSRDRYRSDRPTQGGSPGLSFSIGSLPASGIPPAGTGIRASSGPPCCRSRREPTRCGRRLGSPPDLGYETVALDRAYVHGEVILGGLLTRAPV